MWRCHCGEINLNTAAHCRSCLGGRTTHEDREGSPKPRERQKTVYMGFFGLGMGDNRGEAAASRPPLSETELADYYARARRRLRLTWALYILGALAVAALLVWQVLRTD